MYRAENKFKIEGIFINLFILRTSTGNSGMQLDSDIAGFESFRISSGLWLSLHHLTLLTSV